MLAFIQRSCIRIGTIAAVKPIQLSLSAHSQRYRSSHTMSSQIKLLVKKLSDKAIIPSRGSSGAAGYDLSSAKDVVIPARGKGLCPTDLAIALPEGVYGRVAPRSGLAWKNAIDVGAGVIDEDYRGNVGVILFNHGDQDFVVKAGDRVAQLILERIAIADVEEVAGELPTTVRGEGGFGSTGVSGASASAVAGVKRKADGEPASNGTQPISVTGTYHFQADASVNRPELTHTYTLTAADATVNTLVSEVDQASVPSPQVPLKAQRATANTFATLPSDIPRSCPTQPVLQQLVSLLHHSQKTSDQFLTQAMGVKTTEPAAMEQ